MFAHTALCKIHKLDTFVFSAYVSLTQRLKPNQLRDTG